jgi:ADP-ribosyl-[dinitrogen reductase] hydrolase
MEINDEMLSRAAGCLAGEFCGDAYGAQYEFNTNGEEVSRLIDENHGGMNASKVWHTPAGQVTDDSEMAIALAESIISEHGYSAEAALKNYISWKDTKPHDIGGTVKDALDSCAKERNPFSESNGSLMRVAPLGIYCAASGADAVKLGAEDAAITHIKEVCLAANSAYTNTIAYAVRNGGTPEEICGVMLKSTDNKKILETIKAGMDKMPGMEMREHIGHVILALQIAVYQLTHAKDTREAIIEASRIGGDTDTNAAIAGALVGAVRGFDSLPAEWIKTVQECDTTKGRHPRELYQNKIRDIKALARDLLTA